MHPIEHHGEALLTKSVSGMSMPLSRTGEKLEHYQSSSVITPAIVHNH